MQCNLQYTAEQGERVLFNTDDNCVIESIIIESRSNYYMTKT